jgi:hypothetical protein
MPEHKKTKSRHVSKPAAARETSPASSAAATSSATASGSSSHRRDLLDGSIKEVSRKTLMERFRKRGRVESANYEPRPYEERDRVAASTTLQSNSSSFANTADGAAPIMLRAGRAPHHGTFLVHKNALARPQSAPNLTEQADDEVIARIFPDICPRELRIAEVKSWDCPWMDKEFPVSPDSETPALSLQLPKQGELLSQAAQPKKKSDQLATPQPARANAAAPAPATKTARSNELNRTDAHQNAEYANNTAREFENEISSITNQLSLEEKRSQPASPVKKASAEMPSPVSPPSSGASQWKTVDSTKRTPGSRPGKRPQLRLKLEDMPTPQQAEERAQRAATRLIAKRDAMEAAAIAAAAASGSNTPVNGPSAAQQAMMKLNFSSGSESDLQSPNGALSGHALVLTAMR